MRMACPKRGDEEMIKRALRYLKGAPRVVYHYSWEGEVGNLTVYADSDWGGDKEERRSASGGVIMHGRHLVGHWSLSCNLVPPRVRGRPNSMPVQRAYLRCLEYGIS